LLDLSSRAAATAYAYAIRLDSSKTTGHIDQVPQRNLKEQLIDGGSKVLFEKGFHAASVNHIVAAAGVPKGSFYNHFDSKEALALEVTARYARSYRVDQLPAGEGSPLARLRAHFEAIIERTVARGVELGCLLGNFSTELVGHSQPISEYVAASFDQWSAAVAATLEQAQAVGELAPSLDTTALGAFIVDAYEGAVARAKVSGDPGPLDTFLATTFDVLLAQ
jgi:TetR/AcrR family transcriptional repressor of nem operon